jgi:REP-associated tyrosine transposase
MRRRDIPGTVRLITFSCQGRLPLLANPEIYKLFLDSLDRARVRYGMAVYAFVLMPEHVHLLVEPGSTSLDRPLLSLKLSVAKQVVARWNELRAPILDKLTANSGKPRFWLKGGGHDRNIRDRDEFSRVVRYIHRNPVERALVERPQDWQWSSVHWWMGQREKVFVCDPPPGDERAWKDWAGYM